MDPSSPSVQSILRRVDGDLHRGDYKSAEMRLSGYLHSKGYDAELLARLGQIAHDMRDPFSAGRYWLLSSAGGPEVDAAVDLFFRRCGQDSWQVASQVPRFARMKKVEDYPSAVQNRLRELKITEAITARASGKLTPGKPTTWQDRMLMTGCLTSAVIGALVMLAGIYQVTQWFR